VTSLPPILLVTCGDPAGIGPEVVCLAWQRTAAHGSARLRVVADAGMLADVLATRPGLPALTVRRISADDPRPSHRGEILAIPSAARGSGPAPVDAAPPPIGVPSALGGEMAAAAVLTASTLVREGRAAALVTGPLHKEALHAAGFDVPGHTELLARDCGLSDEAVSMMLWLPAPDGGDAVDGLGVAHATLHEPLRAALARLSPALITAAGRRLDGGLGALLGRRPRIAVAALNPHAGEGGIFGDDEARLVAPAVAALVSEGVDACGPLPADTLFVRASQGAFDGIVALYHDQGHIPIKLLGMHRAVNVTLGLPIVRTSVAHGTAFDIVGRGLADPASMLAAIDAALRLVAAKGSLTAASARAASGAPR